MQRMRDILRNSLGRSLRELPDEDRLAAAWPVACGHSLAAHGDVQYLDHDGILHVRVDGREWLEQFIDIRSALAADLARIASVRLNGLHFEERGRAPARFRKDPPRKEPKA